MFTGIITHLGTITDITNATFTFAADASLCKKIEQGTSVAVNGICLTVEKHNQTTFSITIMPQTQKKTMLQTLHVSDTVNLELPVTPQTLLSGHIVQGHVDGVGKIVDMRDEGNSKILTIHIPKNLNKYIVEKGSITLNGISLTVMSVNQTSFTVGIIPYTWKHTMLHMIKIDDLVNIETDVLAKYLEKLVGKEEASEKN